jgi:hypothetical protein
MTPEERRLVSQLFDRLSGLEARARDPEAEAAIREGLSRAPNAVYPLVQTVLVQEQALASAQERIRELESELGVGADRPRQEGGFLEGMRDTLFGRREERGSVPSVRDGAMGVPPGFQRSASGLPATTGAPVSPAAGGGSFLGTAAAAAAGVVMGALGYQALSSMLGRGTAPSGDVTQQAGLDHSGQSPLGGGPGADRLEQPASFEPDDDIDVDFGDLV